MRFYGAIFVMATLNVLAPTRAAADDASLGISLAPLLGRHVESGLRAALPPVPIPILHVRGRAGPAEIYAEGLPGSPSIDESNGRERLSTHIAFFDAVVRGYVLRDRLSLGIGELIYNQATRYDVDEGSLVRPRTVSAINSSRVVGLRYELGVGLLRDPNAGRFLIDLEPGMHGAINFGSPFAFDRTPTIGESGSQVEMQLQARTIRGPLEVGYGLRYINYATKFDSSGALADRNTGFLPYIMAAYHIGR